MNICTLLELCAQSVPNFNNTHLQFLCFFCYFLQSSTFYYLWGVVHGSSTRRQDSIQQGIEEDTNVVWIIWKTYFKMFFIQTSILGFYINVTLNAHCSINSFCFFLFLIQTQCRAWRPSRDTAQATSSACMKSTTCSSPATGWTKSSAPGSSTTFSSPFPDPTESRAAPHRGRTCHSWPAKVSLPHPFAGTPRLGGNVRKKVHPVRLLSFRRGQDSTAHTWGCWRCGGRGELVDQRS